MLHAEVVPELSYIFCEVYHFEVILTLHDANCADYTKTGSYSMSQRRIHHGLDMLNLVSLYRIIQVELGYFHLHSWSRHWSKLRDSHSAILLDTH